LDKLEQLKHELYSKYRLVEEERRHFVFKLDTRDEQEMLEQKEKEDKKKAKRQMKEAKIGKETSIVLRLSAFP
jgi:hypothetical protein